MGFLGRLLAAVRRRHEVQLAKRICTYIRDANVTALRDLLVRRCCANCKNRDGETPLQVLVRSADGRTQDASDDITEMLQTLLENGADIHASGRAGNTPFQDAVLCSDPKTLDMLFDNGASMSATDQNGRNPLHVAIEMRQRATGRAEVRAKRAVTMLLDRGVDLRARDKDGRTPLHVAVEGSHSDVLIMLMAHGALDSVRNCGEETVLPLAVSSGHPEIVRCLLDGGMPITMDGDRGRELMSRAVRSGSGKVVDLLIDYAILEKGGVVNVCVNIDPNDVEKGFALLKRITDRGIRVRLQGQNTSTCLRGAANRACQARETYECEMHMKVVRWCVDAGADTVTTIEQLGRDLNHYRRDLRECVRDIGSVAVEIGPLVMGSMLPDTLLTPRGNRVQRCEQIIEYLRANLSGSLPKSEVKATPTDPWEIAIVAAESGQRAVALEAFRRAIETNPGYYCGVIEPSAPQANACWKEAVERYRRETNAKASASKVPATHCYRCGKDIGTQWHYEFETGVFAKDVGGQCKQCGLVLCADDRKLVDPKNGHFEPCPVCSVRMITIGDGSAVSSMVDIATRECRYTGTITRPSVLGRPVKVG